MTRRNTRQAVALSRRCVFLAAAAWPLPGLAQAQPLSAPNVVAITPMLVTSGQPPVEALKGLRQLGFEAVICLVPDTVPGAVKDEPDLLQQQGIEFIYVPIPFNKPEAHHVATVAAALSRLQSKKVLVHCEVNMRASSMVFLYRVIHDHEEPARAYEAVMSVWTPRGPWRQLIEAQLRQHAIGFELY